jgi:hypothetical protein
MDKHITSAPGPAPTARDRWAARLATARPQAPSPAPNAAEPQGVSAPKATATAQEAPVAEPTRRPGRPAKGQRPLTDAERQAESRRRRREAAVSVTDDLRAADDAALLAGLALRLKDTQVEGELSDTARWVAGRILGELCRRHGIEPQGFVMVTKGDRA